MEVVISDPSIKEFATFLIRLTSMYGPPTTIEYKDPEQGRAPHKAHWSNKRFKLEVSKRPEFGTVTLVWALHEVNDRIDAARGANKPPANSGDKGLDPDILDIMKD